MYGYVAEGHEGGMGCRQMLGLWFCCLTLPAKGRVSSLRRRRWWKKFQKAGVRRAVVPLSLTEEAAQWGIAPVEVFSLRRCLLPQLLEHCPPLRGKTVRLAAPYVTAAVETAAEVLAQQARYMDLQVGQGGEGLALHLQRRYGLAVGAVGAATLSVRFDGGGMGRCLHLGEDCARHEAVLYHVERLADAGIEAEEQLISTLWGSGYIEKEEIQIKSILFNA